MPAVAAAPAASLRDLRPLTATGNVLIADLVNDQLS
jgi:hypothetical protein